MSQIFVDTGFVIALINQRDQYHQEALELRDRYKGYSWLTTDVVLLEIGNGLARNNRRQAVEIIERFLNSDEVEIVTLNLWLFKQALDVYKKYQDKTWGLVDCVSFVVMSEKGVNKALSFDGRDFVQAGFQVLNA